MTKLYEVQVARLNVRSGPGTDHDVTEVLKRGDLLYPVIDWLPVWLEPGTEPAAVGWVSARYVETVEEAIEPEPQPIPSAGEPPWVTVAKSQIGVSEVPGAGANPQILNYFMATSFRPSRGDEDPWCSGLACWCMEQGGYRSPRDARAISWRSWGRETEPRLGAVVVFPHHVGFFMGRRDDGRIDLLGGNQSNRVSIAPYGIEEILAYRWPL
jgi:uncharacterized protein (TIGR02594 family)